MCTNDFTFTVPFPLVLIFRRPFSLATVFRQVDFQWNPLLLIHCKKNATIKDRSSRSRFQHEASISKTKFTWREKIVTHFVIILSILPLSSTIQVQRSTSSPFLFFSLLSVCSSLSSWQWFCSLFSFPLLSTLLALLSLELFGSTVPFCFSENVVAFFYNRIYICIYIYRLY